MNKNILLAGLKTQKDIENYIPSNLKLSQLASHFYAFSDPTRLKIISCLSLSKMCVNDMSELLCLNQTTLSHQLKILKSQCIVKNERLGKIVVYSLAGNIIDETMNLGANFICANF